MITQETAVARLGIPARRVSTVNAPPFWASTWYGVRRLFTGRVTARPPNAARDSLLLDAAVALRGGRVDEASALLEPHAGALSSDAAYLNLLGAAAELRLKWKLARRFYGVAMSMDADHAPAQQNMRRLYELHTFGLAREPLALGDAEIRRNRTVTNSHDRE